MLASVYTKGAEPPPAAERMSYNLSEASHGQTRVGTPMFYISLTDRKGEMLLKMCTCNVLFTVACKLTETVPLMKVTDQ